jgi:alpha-1,3-rhamnosyl/mannosyltransferase
VRIVIDGRYVHERYPGVGRSTSALVQALGECPGDHELLVLHDTAGRASPPDFAPRPRPPRVRLVNCSVPLRTPAEHWRVPLAVRRLRPAVYHTPFYLKPLATPCPTVVTIHDLVPLRVRGALPSRYHHVLFLLACWAACRTARAILVPSATTRRALLARLRVPAARVHVTPWAAGPAFRPQTPAEVAGVRRRYGLPERYVLHLGTNKPHKNLPRLVQAWARVTAQHPQHGADRTPVLVLAGRHDGRYRETRQLVQRLGLAGSVVFAGEIAERDLPALYSGATLFVFPSLDEGFGLPPLEAMACGTPVVCARTGALPEVVGNAALTVDPRDTGSLAATIGAVLGDAALRHALAGRGLLQAARFSWERTAVATLEAYRAAANLPSAR